MQWLVETALSHASVNPGGKGYGEVVFNDLDTVHENRAEEVDTILEAYDELKDMGNKGFGAGSIATAWDIMQRHLGRIVDLAKDAGIDILINHPQPPDRFGDEFEELKHMGENYGPEAKKMVDQTWNQIQNALKSGFSFETFGIVKNLADEAT
jgi:sugar phosphate isomerase/epimerase